MSEPFFGQLTEWFRQGEDQIPFCEFLTELDLHEYEKLAFLQVYSFENEPLVKHKGSKELSDWYPRIYTGDDCLGFDSEKDLKRDCNCKVLSRGSNFARPTEGILNAEQIIKPTVDQYIAYGSGDKTYVDLFQAGAAKYVALRQKEASGGMSYALSNLVGADNDDDNVVTSAASELKFFLGCVKRGGFSTNLPKECDCERPLDVEYEYTTKLYVKAEKRSCPWSKGAAAQAEDMAFVVALNEATGDINILDAGHAILSRRCNSSWNPDFWINLLDVVQPVLEFYATSQNDTTINAPSNTQIGNFVDGLQVLVETPFSNREGFCETLHKDTSLVKGLDQLILYPNQPMRISLFSSYFVRTRGFGCYRAEASIASDYYLAGVVESKGDKEDEECCSDKFANYILGSLSTPENGDVQNDAVNSLEDRMKSVAFFLSSYGDWEGLQTSSNTGLSGLKGEFGLLKGPSCDGVQDDKRFNDQNSENGRKILTYLYPTVSTDEVTINLDGGEIDFNGLSVYNAQGKEIYVSDIKNLNTGRFTLDISNFPRGNYWIRLTLNGTLETLNFIKL